MGPPLIKAMSAVSRWLNDNRDTFRTIGKIVGTILVEAFQSWRTAIKITFGIIAKFVKIAAGIGRALHEANKAAKNAGAGIRKAIAGFVDAGIKLIKGFGKDAVAFWKNRIWNPITDLLSEKSKGMQTTIDNFKTRAIEIIKSLGKAVLDYWKTSFWGKVASFLIEKATGMGNTLDNFKSWGIKWVKSLPGAIGKPWNAFWDNVANYVIKKKEGILGTMGNLVSGVGKAWEALGGFASKILEDLGLKKDDTKPIPSPSPAAGRGAGMTSDMGMARGGLIGMASGGVMQGPHGGLADGGRPRVVYGEAGPEAYVTLGRKTPESAEALAVANKTWKEKGWSRGIEGVPGDHQHMAKGGLYGSLQGRVHDGGGGSGQYGPTANHLWEDDTFGRVIEVLKNFPVSANTYSNHPPGYPGLQGKSADFWDYAGRGTPISLDLDRKVSGFITSALKTGLSWMLHEGDSGHSGGTRHVHGTWKGPDPGTPNVKYQGGTGGSGGTSGPVPNPEQEKFEKMWAATIDPWGKKWVKRMSPASQFHRGSGAGTSKGTHSIYDFIDAKIPDMIGGSGISGDFGKGGNPSANRAMGKKMLAASGIGGSWGSLDKLWTRESGWNERADNPTSSAYGIPQALPGSKMASSGKDWKTNPQTQIDWGLGYINERYGTTDKAWGHSQSAGWYSRGGIIPGATGEKVLIQAHAGERVLPRDLVKSFDRLAHEIKSWTRTRPKNNRGNRDLDRHDRRKVEEKLDKVTDKLDEQIKKMLDVDSLLDAALRVNYHSPAGRKKFAERAENFVNREIRRAGG